MLNLKLSVKNSVDAKKIQQFADKAAVQILVGFPDGRQHDPTYHKIKQGRHETYDHSDPKDDEPIETSELAKMLSFGTANIPARPFLEDGIKSKSKELEKEIKTQTLKVKEGHSANWDKVGTMAVGAIQVFVRSDHYKSTIPNSQRTIEYKGSDTPLIDGGDLLNDVHYVLNGEVK